MVVDDLPTEKQHGWKFIAFGPDGKLYVPVGAPCNICKIEDPFAVDPAHERRTAAVARCSPAACATRSASTGTRRPSELWFTDNGRDFLGDDAPPDELNHAPKAGMFFGYPFCHGDGIQDPRVRQRPRSAPR